MSVHPPRQTLSIGNISPTTDHKTLRRIFKQFSHFSGFRMTRNAQNPIAFVEFHNIGAAQFVLNTLKRLPLVVEGRTLRVAYANAILPHPNDRPPARAKRKTSEPGKPFQRPSPPPSKAIYIRYESGWWEVPPAELRIEMSKLKGFRSMRFRRTIHTMGFVDFESVRHATAAIKNLKTRDDLGDVLVSYATPKIEREDTNILHLLILRKTSVPLEEVKAVFERFEGFTQVDRLPPERDERSQHLTTTFNSVENASAARRQIQLSSSSHAATVQKSWIRGLVEASFHYGHDPQTELGLSSPTPSNELLVMGVKQQDGLRELFSTYPGFQRLFIARSPGFKHNYRYTGWSIVRFDTVDNANFALQALHGKRWRRDILDIRFQDPDGTSNSRSFAVSAPPVQTNVLFAKEVYGTTQDEFKDAFALRFGRSGGFHYAVLYPDGRGGYMPYGKVIFETPQAAKAALNAIELNPIHMGNGELPIEVEPLHLRRRQQRWKFSRAARDFGPRKGVDRQNSREGLFSTPSDEADDEIVTPWDEEEKEVGMWSPRRGTGIPKTMGYLLGPQRDGRNPDTHFRQIMAS
ncbi:hypothetical protein FRB94_012345 [Tulasnella sp. JGI-2019a]|nr:hypothetical protein FRB94_012345 [Tulasnella sp. JGI-2019a]KAG9033602.1 hypothetical protein FRB95_014590 [Tulasnella sp. JGI-2019a]